MRERTEFHDAYMAVFKVDCAWACEVTEAMFGPTPDTFEQELEAICDRVLAAAPPPPLTSDPLRQQHGVSLHSHMITCQ